MLRVRQANPLNDAIAASINYLKSRHHPEKPHISVLSPPPLSISDKLWGDILRQKSLCIKSTIVASEEEEDVLSDISDLEELYLSRSPGYMFGVDFNKVKLNNGVINATFSFYVRTSYDTDDESKWADNAYTKVKVKVSINQARVGFHITFEPQNKELSKYVKEIDNFNLSVENTCNFTALLILPLNQQEAEAFLRNYRNFIFDPLVSIGLPPTRNYGANFVVLHVGSGRRNTVSNAVLEPIGNYSSPAWQALRGEVYTEGGSLCAYYYPAFSVIAGSCPTDNGEHIVKMYLVNLGGLLVPNQSANCGRNEWEKILKDYCDRGRVFTWHHKDINDLSTRWVLGHLLEVEGEVEPNNNVDLNVQWDAKRGGLINAYTYNAMLIDEEGKYKLRDWHIDIEVLPEIERSNNNAEDYFSRTLPGKLDLSDDCKKKLKPILDALGDAVQKDYRIASLYKYQEEAIEAILASQGLIRGIGKDKVVITARTAGGKTLAFLIPAIIVSAYRKLCRGEEVGVKVMLMYPTKALANDQVEEVSHLLYYLNSRLQERGINFKITFGVLHGNIRHKDDLKEDLSGGNIEQLPMHCPIDKKILELRVSQQGTITAICPASPSCKFASFINDSMKFTRDDIYGEPPDILITDEDMINRVLSGVPRSPPFWFEWSIFGAPYRKCNKCGFTYPLNWNGKKCRVCKADMKNSRTYYKVSAPSIIVLDEGHMLTGSFGAQVHHMLSLLEYVISKINNLTSGNQKITYVLASATIGKPEEFAASLFGVSKNDIYVIKAKTTHTPQQTLRRTFAFIMPKSYTRDATAVRLLSRFVAEYYNRAKNVPKGVVFTNFLDESSELLHSLRSDQIIWNILNGRIGGHTTDYNPDRVEVENEFKAGNLHLLVATSTLEVGIDYGIIDYVMIYGMPNTLTNFIQRIGRAGRIKDAVVFVVFDPEDKIDYYFFENYKLLSNGTYREQALEREVYPVGATNEEAVKRAIQRFTIANLRLCCITGCGNIQKDTACKAIVEQLDLSERSRFWPAFGNHLLHINKINDIPNSLSRLKSIDSSFNNLIDSEFNRIVQTISSVMRNTTNVAELVQKIITGGLDVLYNLRSSDVMIPIHFTKLPSPYNLRYRELRYVVKHALTGQVVSYRGYFFSAQLIQARRASDIRNYFRINLNSDII